MVPRLSRFRTADALKSDDRSQAQRGFGIDVATCRQYNYNRGGVMNSAVSAADANRMFSAMLRGVREGRTFTITSHGQPVARIVPVQTGSHVIHAGRTMLFKRLKAARVKAAGTWTRDELYEVER